MAEAGPPGARQDAALDLTTPVAPAAGPALWPVELAYQRFVGFWRRFVASFVDGVALFVFEYVLVVVLAVTWIMVSGATDSGTMRSLDLAGRILEWVIPLVYNVGFIAWRGQTLGKILLGIRVVTEEGKIPRLGRAILREVLGKLLSGIALGLGFLWVAWDGKKRGWHDHIGVTYVVYEEDYRKNRSQLAS